MTSRTALTAAVLALSLAVAVPAAATPPSAQAQRSATVAEDSGTAEAVRAVTSTELPVTAQISAIPAGFGYAAARGPGYATNPHGDCSSGLPLPDSFTEPCRAHDLGYDLLRHADSIGHPLGGWARRLIDDTFAVRLSAACVAEPAGERRACHTIAGIAVLAVRLNTWRQHDGPPREESAGELVTSWVTAGDRL